MAPTISSTDELLAYLATGARTGWEIETGTIAQCESTTRFETTERGAVIRWGKMARAEPGKIVCLYWVNHTTGQRGGKPYRSQYGDRA